MGVCWEEFITSKPGAEDLQRIVLALLHALAGPLQTIDGFSLILQEDYADRALDLEGWQHLQRIRNDTGRMRMLLDDLGTYLQVLTAELSPELVDFSFVALEVARQWQREDPERSVQWTVAAGLRTEADPTLSHQLLEQLLRNAWKFTRKQAAACIEIGGGAEEDGFVVFVRDNGVGFNNKYSAELFTPFKRLHHREEFAGTGMGLAIVQQIMNRHGGTVRAAGSPGTGATVTLRFPDA